MNEKSGLLATGAAIVGRHKRYIVWFFILNLVLARMAPLLPSTGWPLARSQPPCRWSAAWFRLGIVGELLSNPGFGSTEAVTTPA